MIPLLTAVPSRLCEGQQECEHAIRLGKSWSVRDEFLDVVRHHRRIATASATASALTRLVVRAAASTASSSPSRLIVKKTTRSTLVATALRKEKALLRYGRSRRKWGILQQATWLMLRCGRSTQYDDVALLTCDELQASVSVEQTSQGSLENLSIGFGVGSHVRVE